MKKLILLVLFILLNSTVFSETVSNDANYNQNQDYVSSERPSRRKIKDEDDLLDFGYSRFRLGEAEDNFVFKTLLNKEFEVDIWAMDKRGSLGYYGSIFVSGTKRYKGNPLDRDLDEYRWCFLKVLNDNEAIIKPLGVKHDDQYFEIQ